jgi:ComEC/Rec2-related protein
MTGLYWIAMPGATGQILGDRVCSAQRAAERMQMIDGLSKGGWLGRLRLQEDTVRPLPCLTLVWLFLVGALPLVLWRFQVVGVTGALLLTALLAVGARLVLPAPPRWWYGMVAVGLASAVLRTAAPYRTYIAALPNPAAEKQTIEIDGIVTGDRLIGDDELRRLGDTRNVTVSLRAVRRHQYEPWRPCGGVILLRNPDRHCRYGLRIRAVGDIERPWASGLPGVLNYRHYLETRGIAHVFRARSLDVHSRGPVGWRRAPAAFYAARERVLGQLVRGLDPDGAGSIVAAMTLGFRQNIDSQARRTYMRSGMLHLFAISGLHVGVAFALLLPLLTLVRVPFRARHYAAPALLLIYVIATGAAPSAMRAWMMLGIWSVGRGMRWPVSAVNATLAAALVLLVYNPFYLCQSGFQFSFAVVLALVRGWQAGHLVLTSLQERRHWVPRGLGRTSPLREWLSDRGLRTLLGMTAAWVGGLGLTAYHNSLFLPCGVITNSLVCGLAWLVLVLALAKLATACLFLAPPEWLLGKLLAGAVGGLDGVASIAAAYGAPISVAQPAPAMVLGYYMLLAAALIVPLNIPRLCRFAGALALWTCLMLAPRPAPPAPTVVVAGTGEGGAPVVVVEAPARAPIVVNAGGRGVGSTLAGWLRSRGAARIDNLVLLDGRVAHAGGAPALLAAIPVGTCTVFARERRQLAQLAQPVWDNGCRARLHSGRTPVTSQRVRFQGKWRAGHREYYCTLIGAGWQLKLEMICRAGTSEVTVVLSVDDRPTRTGKWLFHDHAPTRVVEL